MFPEQLKKILNLIKQTGERVVLFDANKPDDSYVVMDFDQYAQMSGAGEALKSVAPKNRKSAEKLAENNNVSAPDFNNSESKAENLTEEDLTDKINREISMWKNREVSSFPEEENKPKKAWSIPPQVKDKAQEVE